MQKLTKLFIIILLIFEAVSSIEQQISRNKRVIEKLQKFIIAQQTQYCSSKDDEVKRKQIESKINGRRYAQAQKQKQIDRLQRKKITETVTVVDKSQKLKVKTKTMIGQEIYVFVNENDTIKKLKQKLAINLGLDSDQIMLKVNKQKLVDLENDKTFRFYDIKEADFIHVVWKIEFKPVPISCQ